MQSSIDRKCLTAWQEVSYLCTYIHQFRQHYHTLAKVELYTNIAACSQLIEHDLLMPFIDDAFVVAFLISMSLLLCLILN